MTKANRERAYAHFRNLEQSYVALDHLNSGATSTEYIRAKAKKDADALLKRNPELETPKVEEVKPIQEQTKSKGKK